MRAGRYWRSADQANAPMVFDAHHHVCHEKLEQLRGCERGGDVLGGPRHLAAAPNGS